MYASSKRTNATEPVLVVKRAKTAAKRSATTATDAGVKAGDRVASPFNAAPALKKEASRDDQMNRTPRLGSGPGTPKEVNLLSTYHVRPQRTPTQGQLDLKPISACPSFPLSSSRSVQQRQTASKAKVPAAAWLSTDDRTSSRRSSRAPGFARAPSHLNAATRTATPNGVQSKLSTFFPRDDSLDDALHDDERRGRQASRARNNRSRISTSVGSVASAAAARSRSRSFTGTIVAGTDDEDDLRGGPVPELSPSFSRRRKRSREVEEGKRTGVASLLDSSPVAGKREMQDGRMREAKVAPKQARKRLSQAATASSSSASVRRSRQTPMIEEQDERSYRPPLAAVATPRNPAAVERRMSSQRTAGKAASDRTKRMYEAFPANDALSATRVAQQPSSPLPILTPSDDDFEGDQRRTADTSPREPKKEAAEPDPDPETSPYVQSVIIPPQIREAHLRLVPGGELYVAQKREQAREAEVERKRTMFKEEGVKLVESDDEEQEKPIDRLATPRKMQAAANFSTTPTRTAPKQGTPLSMLRGCMRTPTSARSHRIRSRSASSAPITPTKPMRDEVQTLAVWSPYRGGETQYALSLGAGLQNQSVAPQELSVGLLAAGDSQRLVAQAASQSAGNPESELSSPDEVLEGTLPESLGYRLLESVHPAGRTDRLDVERQSKRARFAAATPFSQVDGAWASVKPEEATARGSKTGPSRVKPTTTDTKAQSSLAAFGFSKRSHRKRPPRAFETSFEDEAEIDEGEEFVPSSQTQILPNLLHVGRVPSPPLDPRLRPAGIRALMREIEPVAERPAERFVVPSSQASENPDNELLFSDPSLHSSDFARTEDAPSLTKSLNDWWKELDEV